VAQGVHADDLSVVRASVEESIAVKAALLADAGLLGEVQRLAALVAAAVADGRLVLAFGNGGSALDASHLASELVGRFEGERRPLGAVALGHDVAATTAIGNDYGFERLYERQVRALGRPGDVAIGISTSGRSPNVVAGLAAAREVGASTVALTGADPREVGAAADLVIAVPSRRTARVQECHLLVIHLVCELLDRSLGT
jgi:D-sedoheptulose 7-phosphate isomerase